jgi:hypothetical protein
MNESLFTQWIVLCMLSVAVSTKKAPILNYKFSFVTFDTSAINKHYWTRFFVDQCVKLAREKKINWEKFFIFWGASNSNLIHFKNISHIFNVFPSSPTKFAQVRKLHGDLFHVGTRSYFPLQKNLKKNQVVE